ncbi:putative phenylpropionate dioxygenase [Hyaloraphidium curvatum]|nr:putative phenylpropionate dioxygenase [Hyaloraphidium curvatum]
MLATAESPLAPPILTSAGGATSFPAPTRALPASWFTSEEIYQLERRAIFSRAWLAVCHLSRLETGVPYEDEMANYPFTVLLAEDGTVTAYRGHGMPEDKREKVHVYCTKPGDFVFVNLDAAPEPVPFSEFFPGMEKVLGEFDFTGFKYHTRYEWLGEFNYKTFVDGFQECYHCAIAHPGLAKDYQMDSYSVASFQGWSRHSVARKDSSCRPRSAEGPSSGDADGAWLWLFPNLAINIYSASISIQRLIPLSAVRTRMDISFYRRHGVTDAEVDAYVEFAKVVDREDFDLVAGAQTNLNRGVYGSGLLHPSREAGVIYYQGEIRRMMEAHARAEKAEGREIWPAGR